LFSPIQKGNYDVQQAPLAKKTCGITWHQSLGIDAGYPKKTRTTA